KLRFPTGDGGASARIRGKRRYSMNGYALTCRTQLAKQNPFDENLHRYSFNEDFDFSFRLGRSHLLFELKDIQVRHMETSTSRITDDQYLCTSLVNPAYLIEKLFPNDRSRGRLLRLLRTLKLVYRVEKALGRDRSLTVTSIGSQSESSKFGIG